MKQRPVRILVMAGVWIAGMGCSCVGQEETAMTEAKANVVREAHGAGRWFPARPDELRDMVSGCIAGADDAPWPTGRVAAVLSPHAGYVYSGKVAGYSFRALKASAAKHGAPDTVVVLGLSHRGGFPGVALMDGDALRTPLETTPLDGEAADILVRSSRIRRFYEPHAGEHSAENQVPFVQVALPAAKLVVGLVGDLDAATTDALAGALDELAREKQIVVVASTDLLHDPDYKRVTRVDQCTLETIVSLDGDALAKQWTPSSQVCCGVAPVLTAMRFAESQGCDEGVVLHYRNSGDDHPESRGQWVVGYGAVAFPVNP